MSVRDDYLAAARAVVEQIGRLPEEGWDTPVLGDWSRRMLVGHLASMMTSVIEACAHPAASLGVDRTAGYYAFRHGLDPEVYEAALAAVAEVHAADAAALGDDPIDTVHRRLAEALTALGDVPDDALVSTPVGGMRLGDWLPTRTFELAVHGLDLEAATGVEIDLPPEVLAAATALVATTAAEIGDGRAVLRALTGRGALPTGYSAL
jgi:uncharacterized protein (TIGR03083 family)